MNPGAGLSAFAHTEFHSVFDQRQVWLDRPGGHIPLHEAALRRFRNSLERVSRLPAGATPQGLCFVGPAGVGKTHLLGEIRRASAEVSANFILVDLTDVRDFWALLALRLLESIQREMNGVRQVHRMLEQLLSRVSDLPDAAAYARRRELLAPEGVRFLTDRAVRSLARTCGHEFERRQRVFRALLYLESGDVEMSERAYSFLQGIEQTDEAAQAMGLRGPNSPREVVRGLAWFLNQTGPTVLAFDQLDPFIAQNHLALSLEPTTPRLAEAHLILTEAVNGIFAVRDLSPRLLVVLACLESSWNVLNQHAASSFADRFEQPVERLRMVSGEGQPDELVARRLDESYRLQQFAPPYRTWPFAPDFFRTLPPSLTPREILNRCERHRQECLNHGEVLELESYEGSGEPAPVLDLSRFDEQIARLSAAVPAARLLEEGREDELGAIVGRAAELFRRELPVEPEIDVVVEQFRATRQYQTLHLRMRRIYRGQDDREEHVSVRVLQKSHPRSFLVRLAAAITESGISEQIEGRRLFLLRDRDLPAGPRSAEAVDQAGRYGAQWLSIDPDDLRTLAAVVELAREDDPLFEAWLLERRPLSRSGLFRRLVPSWIPGGESSTGDRSRGDRSREDWGGRPASHSAADVPSRTGAAPARNGREPEPAGPPAELAPDAGGILVGYRRRSAGGDEPVRIPAVDLTRHVMIRAGAGGGKTVLIKRLVEEAALNGISSLVIDTARDLSLLGDRWAEPPESWTGADRERADRYHREVDVRIWTPGHPAGRPLRLSPLPNLSGPFEEHDREQAVQVALQNLLPLAAPRRNPAVERAILVRVLAWLTWQSPPPGGEMDQLIAALRDLPGEACQGYQNERRLAQSMADQIQATLVGDALYGGVGEVVDPSLLFGVGQSRPRVSVISLFAMPEIATQARFIGQLGSFLFHWIRHNPAPPDSPVRGLLVLDEAARFLPRYNEASKPALLLLAQQARKYGLGMVMATQNPKDLDYTATANFATQLWGTASVPQVVRFIEETLAQRGISGLKPGMLRTGEFFCVSPSLPEPVEIRTPMCLSAHPHNTQLSDEQILSRALDGKIVTMPVRSESALPDSRQVEA